MGMRKLPRRVSAWFRSNSEIVADVDDEISFHLEMRVQRLLGEGRNRTEAEEQARREFGDAGELRRNLTRRDERKEFRRRAMTALDELRQDVRFAWRGFARTPAFTTVAIATLVLGIGASVAMFTVVNAVMLRPLPYPDSERLVQLWPGQNFCISLADAAASGSSTIVASTGIAQWGLTLTGRGDAAELQAQVVDAGFFDVFGVQPVLGRAFTVEERDPIHSDVVVISHSLWQTRFGGDRAIIGTRLQLDGYDHRTREIIGVMPRDFVAPLVFGDRVDMWIPLHLTPGRALRNDSTWYVNNVVALLKPGATVEATAVEVSAALKRARDESGLVISDESLRSIGAVGLLASLVGDTGRALWLLLGAVGLVLLLACANLANLLLARGERRRSELAARAALGGTRGRLVRELLTEGAMLATAGAIGGIILARVILNTLRVADSAGLPRNEQFAIDARVVAFTVIVTAVAVLLFALLPALRATSGDLRPALGSGRRSAGTTVAGRRLGSALIACEVALAMMLVTGASLLLASFRSVRSVDPGIDAHDVLAVRLSPSATQYRGANARRLYDELLERISVLPGVRTAGAIHLLPFTEANWDFPYLAEGHTPPANAPLPSANFRTVTPDYFDAVDVQVLHGRAFTRQDAPEAPAVGIINRTFAEMLWPGQDAVGREIKLFGSNPFRVVGVVEDVHQHTLRTKPLPEMYLPYAQFTGTAMILMIEADLPPSALIQPVQSVIRTYDPNVPVADIRPLADVLSQSLRRDRFYAQVLAFFGLLALVLGGVGVYGVMAYAMSARVPEFSVRLALGATHGRVVNDALRGGLVPVGVGLVVGTVAALAAGQLLRTLLHGVKPHDPLLLTLSVLVLGVTAVAASWLPTRRVRSVQPMSVLNSG